ncbi:MAG TPA: dUTP diphosphatase [Ignavibacteria bacterium]|nr:dUTP diphosphatase [Bacteroidota bacterium]HRI84929.1 dUTP diphosphatase [Ignavibacteria bacterium]HRK00126.1 dUTP diphosphatase [Ignavibacteria bacterium]
MIIYFKIADPHRPVYIPEYKTSGSAGMDLCCSSYEKIVIPKSEYTIVPTNLIMEIPEGFEAQVRPRSGLALKSGITVLNSPGTIDSDYRGEIKVLLINHGKSSFEINSGDRIAQLVISSHEKCELIKAENISLSERGDGGYGSTGID